MPGQLHPFVSLNLLLAFTAVPAQRHPFVRRRTAPNGPARSRLPFPSVFQNRRDVAAELLGHPLTCLVNLVDDRVTIR